MVGEAKLAAILLVEDNPGDIRLTLEALKDCKLRNHVAVVQDGEAALAYLRAEPPFAGAPRPDLLLLDLNLPRKDGWQVLAEIKADPNLRGIPVVVMTASENEHDVWRSYDLQAACYLTKPVDVAQFLSLVQSLEHFWLAVVTLPGASVTGGM